MRASKTVGLYDRLNPVTNRIALKIKKMRKQLEKKIFLIGLGAAIIFYFLARQFEAPELILVLSLGVAAYQYLYLPGKTKS